MEPRPHERGNALGLAPSVTRALTSMEPRPHERGNLRVVRYGHHLPPSLQWSHVLTNVETFGRGRIPAFKSVTSMEPRPHERGNLLHRRQGRHKTRHFNGATSSRTWKPRAAR